MHCQNTEHTRWQQRGAPPGAAGTVGASEAGTTEAAGSGAASAAVTIAVVAAGAHLQRTNPRVPSGRAGAGILSILRQMSPLI
jgi:hypothetical protein